MSSIKSLAPFRITPRRSLWLAALLLFMHIGASIIIILLPLPVWAKALPGAVLAINLWFTLSTHILRHSKTAIVEALWDGDGQWTISTADGQEREGRLLPGSYVSTGLIILRFALESNWRRCALVLLPDSLDAATLRQLRVRLLHGADQGPV